MLCKKSMAECIGTFWLVFGGCGSAIFAAQLSGGGGIGLLGVALAFGLTVVTMAYAVGSVSGGHFNPAVSLGVLIAGRLPCKDFFAYVVAQVIGAIFAAIILYWIASGNTGFDLSAGFAANGYGDHSPEGYSLLSGFLIEVITTFMFILIILNVTAEHAPKSFAPLAIGLTLTLIHLISIPLTNTSVNPARSTGPALLVGGWALKQLWLFWVAPLLGAALAGIGYRMACCCCPVVPQKETSCCEHTTDKICHEKKSFP